jgi:hypothetical protein
MESVDKLKNIMTALKVTDPHGRNINWNLYAVNFDSPDGKFSFHIYAISDEHAQLQVDAIRETATLEGQVLALIKD